MTIETAEQAAQAFETGGEEGREQCRDWCHRKHDWRWLEHEFRFETLAKSSPHFVAARTAAVALELGDVGIMAGVGVEYTHDFLCMMRDAY